MLCNVCHKNEATIHVTEIINDEVQEVHICEACAKKKGIMMNHNYGLADFMAGLTDFGLSNIDNKPQIKSTFKCPECGMSFDDFKKIGRLGCGGCYEAFKKGLAPLLKKVHGSSQHIGKVPIRAGEKIKAESELQRLEQSLIKAIEQEAFEEAAGIRDEIKEFKSKKAEGK